MKKVLLAISVIAVLFTASSCNSTKSLTSFLTKHNFKETHTINPATGQAKIHASIDSLYDYSKVVELCDTADVTFHISKGSIVVDADCTGAGETLVAIFKKIISKINFIK
jgi:hypothetical protein